MDHSVWLGIVVAVVLALMQLSSIARSLDRVASSHERTAAMLKRLLAHQGVEWETDTEPSARVKSLALNAKTYVDAIKAYREQTGLGLRDAKAVIDRHSHR